MKPSITISALAGTSRSTVSQRTSSAGSPREAGELGLVDGRAAHDDVLHGPGAHDPRRHRLAVLPHDVLDQLGVRDVFREPERERGARPAAAPARPEGP